MACEHPLDTEYLYPADSKILEFRTENGETMVDLATLCPECDETLKLSARVERSEEAVGLNIVLGDPEEPYDD